MSAMPGSASPSFPERPRLLSLPNGEKATPVFSRDGDGPETLETPRLDGAGRRSDACLFTSIHNVNYFGGFVYCSFGRHYGLVVTHDAHTIIGANLDYGRPWRRSFADSIAYTDWHRDNFFHAARSLCPSRGRIGIERRPRDLRGAGEARGGAARMRNSSTRARRRCACGWSSPRKSRRWSVTARRSRTSAAPRASRPSPRACPSTRSRCTRPGRWCARSRAAIRTSSCRTPGRGFSPASTPTARTTRSPRAGSPAAMS